MGIRIAWADAAGKKIGDGKYGNILKDAGLNWTVEKEPIYFQDGNKKIAVNGRYAMVRSDNKHAIGLVGNDYTAFQNHQLLDWANGLREFVDVQFHSAGELHGGKRVWLMLRLDEKAWKWNGGEVFPRFFLGNAHDGSKTLTLTPSTIDVICQNALNMAFKNVAMVDGFRIHHGAEIVHKAREAQKLVIQCSEAWKETRRDLDVLAHFPVKPGIVDTLLEEVFGKIEKDASKAKVTRRKNLKDSVMDVYNGDHGKTARGENLWNAFSAVTEIIDHESPFHSESDGEAVSEAHARFESNVLGVNAKRKAQLFDFALSIAK